MDTLPAQTITVWIVDPIDHGGMAYYDAGLARGLAEAGASVLVIGTDQRLLPVAAGSGWRQSALFRGPADASSRVSRGIRYLHALLRLVRAARRVRPSVVIWQYPDVPVADLLAMRGLLAVGSRLIFVAHELEPWSQSLLARFTRRAIVRCADLVLCHGQPEAEALRTKYGLASGTVLTTGHGDYRWFVDTAVQQSDARARLGLPSDVPVALFFGSLRTSKGLALLLAAWPAVRARLPDARLLIAGRPLHGVSIEIAEANGVSFRQGLVSHGAANDFYAAADIVVIPYDRVTTSGVMRHAYSAGRPVVATTIGELGRHVLPGETGWLVPPDDRGALSNAVVDALSDRKNAAELGQRAKAYGEAQFDWQRIGAETHAAILRLLAE